MAEVIFVRFSNCNRDDQRVRVKKEAFENTTVRDALCGIEEVELEHIIKIEAYDHGTSAFKEIAFKERLSEVFDVNLSDFFHAMHAFGKSKQLLLTLASSNECSTGAIAGKAFDLHANKMPLFGGELILNTVHGNIDRDANSNGKTGLSTWDASIVLAQYIAMNTEATADKTVIELGAGTGCVGITSSFLSPPPRRVILTDQLYAIENLHMNVESNRLNSGMLMRTVPEVRELDWMKEETYLLSDIEPQKTVILAADVAWLRDLVPPLLNAISSHLVIGGEMYLAHQKRSEIVDHILFSGLAKCGLETSEVPFDELHPSFRSDRIKVFRVVAGDKRWKE